MDQEIKIYCLKCREFTDTRDVVRSTTSNNRNIMKGICTVCEKRKNKFIKATNLEIIPEANQLIDLENDIKL